MDCFLSKRHGKPRVSKHHTLYLVFFPKAKLFCTKCYCIAAESAMQYKHAAGFLCVKNVSLYYHGDTADLEIGREEDDSFLEGGTYSVVDS